MSRSIGARHPLLKEFSQSTIFFPEFAIAFSKLCDAIELCNLTKSPMSAIVCGPSGVGKTKLLQEAIDKYAHEFEDEQPDGLYNRETVIYFEVPAPVTIRQMVESMLIKLGIDNARGSIAHLTAMLITQLKTRGVELIFLDEIQALCLPSADTIRVPALRWLVNFMDELGIPVILAGTEECRNITDYLEPFGNRYPWMIVLNFVEYDRRPDSHYHRILEKFDYIMHSLWPMTSEVHLNDVDIAAPLFVATSGNLKWISTILIMAFHRCLSREKKSGLTREDLKYACDQYTLKYSITTKNPFLLDLAACTEVITNTEHTRKMKRVPE